MTKFPKRKSTRLKDYDYSAPGAYFITVCVKSRSHILGKIVGDGTCDVPKMELSEYGYVLEKYIDFMSKKYSYMQVDKYVIMPNHFHMIVRITEDIRKNGTLQAPSPTNQLVPKFVSLLKRYCNRQYGENIWQRSSNDHIIRGQKDYDMIWKYIDTNVRRWEKDCFYIKSDM